MSSLIIVSIVLILVTVIVNLVINENLRKYIQKILNEKVFWMKIKYFILILAFVIFLSLTIKIVESIKYNLRALNYSYKENEEMLESEEKRVTDEKALYNKIFEMPTNIENCKNPYIPEKFKYIEGNWNTGFVIQDEQKNEFVWVPCTNIENNDGIPILRKQDFSSNSFIKSTLCYDDCDYLEDFLTSALKNGGFYISRYEIGKDENSKPVSQKDYEIYTNISKDEVETLVDNMENSINSKLINGYAYDTAFKFIYNDINSKTNKTKRISGTKSIKNIYDIVDDMYEITTEICYENNVIRGISSKDDVIDYLDNRLMITDTAGDNFAFRIIIYK